MNDQHRSRYRCHACGGYSWEGHTPDCTSMSDFRPEPPAEFVRNLFGLYAILIIAFIAVGVAIFAFAKVSGAYQ